MADDWIAGGVGSLMSDIEAGKSVEYVMEPPSIFSTCIIAMCAPWCWPIVVYRMLTSISEGGKPEIPGWSTLWHNAYVPLFCMFHLH